VGVCHGFRKTISYRLRAGDFGAQAAERKKTLVCKEALRQAAEENPEGFRGVPQNFTVA
jgi:hypothetical protein